MTSLKSFPLSPAFQNSHHPLFLLTIALPSLTLTPHSPSHAYSRGVFRYPIEEYGVLATRRDVESIPAHSDRLMPTLTSVSTTNSNTHATTDPKTQRRASSSSAGTAITRLGSSLRKFSLSGAISRRREQQRERNAMAVVTATAPAPLALDGPIMTSPLITTTHTTLPDLLPPDLLVLLVENLVASESLATLAALQRTSKSNYDLVTPFLHQRRQINTGSFTLDKILSTDTSTPIEELEKKARKSGKLWTAEGGAIRNRIHMQFVQEVIVDALPPDAIYEPKKRVVISSTTPVPNVETVTITPNVLHDLSLFFSAHISENFLRPLATACTPSHLILRHPDDTALGSYKHLMNLVDELRWPQLRKLTLHNIGAHALPGRSGLEVVVVFAEGVPIKWNAGDLPIERLLRKYERSRATQVLMAIPRSVRARDGVEGLGDMRWKFVHAGRFFGEKYAQESTENLREAVRAWAKREYMSAGWEKEGVEELLSRIEFVA